jgi:hypothetical protein
MDNIKNIIITRFKEKLWYHKVMENTMYYNLETTNPKLEDQKYFLFPLLFIF